MFNNTELNRLAHKQADALLVKNATRPAQGTLNARLSSALRNIAVARLLRQFAQKG